MEEFQLTTLYIDYGHLISHMDLLARAISESYYRCAPLSRPPRLPLKWGKLTVYRTRTASCRSCARVCRD